MAMGYNQYDIPHGYDSAARMNKIIRRIFKSRQILYPQIWEFIRILFPYLGSLVAIMLVTLIGLAIQGVITPTNLVMPYLLAVVTIAVVWGLGPAIFASVLGVATFDIFLIPPYLTLVVEDTEYIITFISLFIVGGVISSLTSQIREQMLKAQEKETRISSLYNLSQKLAVTNTLDDTLHEIMMGFNNLLKCEIVIYLVNFEEQSGSFRDLRVHSYHVDVPTSVKPSVCLAFEQGITTGAGTNVYDQDNSRNLPLSTKSGILGVLSILVEDDEIQNHAEQRKQLDAFITLSAMALERIYLNIQASQTEIIKAKEELQSALLNSISHDFRTPLVTITGTLSSLDSDLHKMDPNTRKMLIRQAYREAEKLNQLVSNLLNMSRLESGGLLLQQDLVDVQDLIGSTLQRMQPQLNRPVSIHIPDEIPLIKGDFVLLEQALMNVLDNAQKYSPEGSSIDVFVRIENPLLYLEIRDQGPGVNEEELSRIFDKFYQGKDTRTAGGSGLGLAIVKGIIDAHSAELNARNRNEGGLIIEMGFLQHSYQEKNHHET